MHSRFRLAGSNGETRISWLLLLSLLVLRIPFWGGAFLLLPSQPPWIEALFQVGTYLLTALFIWWERATWTDYHIDSWSILIIILFKPSQTLFLASRGENALAFPNGASLLIWGIAIALYIVLRRNGLLARSSFTVAGLQWFYIGAACGLLGAVVIGFLESFQLDARAFGAYHPGAVSLIAQGLWLVPYQIGYAAVSEEPLFRGFLWGHLRKLGWKDRTIWLFQAGLFTLAHIYYLTQHPLSFWVLVPFGALLFGFLVWRSRTITSSIAAHAVMNAMSAPLAFVIIGIGV